MLHVCCTATAIEQVCSMLCGCLRSDVLVGGHILQAPVPGDRTCGGTDLHKRSARLGKEARPPGLGPALCWAL
jgi:hypothetical protein